MKRLLTALLWLLAIVTVATRSVIAAPYGDGSYGSGTYGSQSSNASNAVAAAVSSVQSTISNIFCGSQAPASAPDLFQIDVTDSTATLHFSPATAPYDKHYVSYGRGDRTEDHGVEFGTNSVKGAIKYEVKHLHPGAVYTFKARGGNGCKPGPWSNTLTVKTNVKNNKVVAKFFKNKQASYTASKPQTWTQRAQSLLKNVRPKQTKAQTSKPGQPTPTPQQKTHYTPPDDPLVWWTNLTSTVSNFFKGN